MPNTATFDWEQRIESYCSEYGCVFALRRLLEGVRDLPIAVRHAATEAMLAAITLGDLREVAEQEKVYAIVEAVLAEYHNAP